MSAAELETGIFSSTENENSASVNDAEFFLENVVPTNEFKIAIPPGILDCREDCKHKGDNSVCIQTRHHLHSTEVLYALAGEEAYDFRDLRGLTAWLYRCRHEEHHSTYNLFVPPPKRDVMRQGKSEERALRHLLGAHRQIEGDSRVIELPDTTINVVNGLKRARERLLIEKNRQLEKVLATEVLPEEIVTSALLIAAPRLAKGRIINGSGVTLSGLLKREELPLAIQRAQLYQDQAEAIWLSRQKVNESFDGIAA